jgi:lysyl-tRNA synthetase class 2
MSDEYHEESVTGEEAQRRQRIAKVEAMRARGSDPYPVRFERDTTAAAVQQEYGDLAPGTDTGEEAAVAGRLVGMRNIGKLIFAVLQDASGRIQLFVDRGVLGDGFDAFADLDLGDWVGASGEVITTRRGELSVRVTSFALLAKSLRPLPEKWHGLQDQETRFRRRYLDLVANEESRRVFAARAAMVRSLRDSFTARGFVEVETPMLQSQPGGALARPFVTHHNALDRDMYLRVAPELYLKRLIVGGMERVFELNRNFRNEGLSTRHSPEFTMLEAYQAFADYHDVMELTEEVIAAAAVAVHGSTAFTYQDRPLDLAPPWRRLSVGAAIEEVTGVEMAPGMDPEDLVSRARALDVATDPAWGPGKIIIEVFEHLVEPDLWEPTLIIDYPREVSPLARTHRSDPLLAERFEFFAGGWELGNAFSELNDPFEQRVRFEEQAEARDRGDEEAHRIDEDYLLALEYGLPPTGGLGIGVDRLAMLLADKTTIREVILFPHLRTE